MGSSMELSMLLAVLVVVACFGAGFFQLLALVNNEQPILQVARRITGVALLSASAYIGYTLYAFGTAHVVYCWILGLFSLGQFLFSMHTFMEPQCATALIQRKGPSNETSHA